MGWFRDLFRKKPPGPIADLRGKGDEFKPGDLAICVRANWIYPDQHDPKEGDLLHVSVVRKNIVGDAGILSDFLGFREKPPHRRWCHTGFRKVEQRHEKADMTVEEMIKGKKIAERTS